MHGNHLGVLPEISHRIQWVRTSTLLGLYIKAWFWCWLFMAIIWAIGLNLLSTTSGSARNVNATVWRITVDRCCKVAPCNNDTTQCILFFDINVCYNFSVTVMFMCNKLNNTLPLAPHQFHHGDLYVPGWHQWAMEWGLNYNKFLSKLHVISNIQHSYA